ncbi:LysR family transcriptional regulator substrate-binding protein [Paenibacillus sp. JTLBN-2024]
MRPEFELGSLDLLVEFARSGFGLTFIARNFVMNELATGKLIEIPLDPPIPERRVGIATLKGVPQSAASKSFIEFLP